MVGFLATSVALVIGVVWGTIAGFSGGKTDAIMMRFVDTLYGIPFIILIILLMVIFGRNLVLLFLAIGAVEWLTMARIVRSQVLNLSKQEFILSAEAMGVSKISIVFRHLIPNAMGPVIVYATLTVPQIMLLESFLSFLKENRNYSEHTLKSYRSDLNKFEVFLNENKILTIVKVNNNLVRNFLGLHRRKGLSPKSLARILSSLRSFFKFLKSEGKFTNDPTVGISAPKQDALLPKALDTDMVDKLLNFEPKSWIEYRDKAMMELIYSSGLRLSELCSLSLKDLLLEEQMCLDH